MRATDAALRVAVVGGSLGGLTAALVLRDAGCDVHVYERSASELTSRGAGIVVQPDTARYFVQHDLVSVDRVSVPASRLLYVNRDGTTAYEEPCKWRFTAWNTLYRHLLRAFDHGRYHLGQAMTGLSQDADEVTVGLSTGERVRHELLVCADGVASTARALLLPEVVPHYAGYVGWRGTVREADLSASAFAMLSEAIIYYVMPHSHILAYPIPAVDGSVDPGRRLINFVWYRNVPEGPELDLLMTDRTGVHRELSLPPGGVQDACVSELREAALDLLPDCLAEVVGKTEEPFIQQIVDLEVPRMAFGRVCLMGDAAFTARPHAAAGTAKASADAWALGEELSRGVSDPLSALGRWQIGQLALGRQLVKRVKEMGDRSQLHCTWRPEDPELRFGLRGPGR